jgi:hypothetical protein
MKRKPFWKSKIIYVLQFALGLSALAAGGLRVGSLDLVIGQLDVIGPREWLGIMAGSLGSGWPRPQGNTSLGLALFQEYESARISSAHQPIDIRPTRISGSHDRQQHVDIDSIPRSGMMVSDS